MALVPYARILMSIAGGGHVSGGQTISGNQTVQLSGENTSDWNIQLWEIYEYPLGFALPTGWTNVNGIYRSTAVIPPIFTVLGPGTWGKYLFRLTVNGGLLNGVFHGSDNTQPLVDVSSGVQVLSSGGAHDVCFGESNQFDSQRQWIGELKRSLRVFATGGGGGGGAVTTVTDLTALAIVDTSAMTDGALAFVQSVLSYFSLNKTSSMTPDGITIVADGADNWIRLDEAHPSWSLRTAWFIDAAVGNDENSGATALLPLRTFAELRRRWGFGTTLAPTSGTCTVTILGSMSSSDPFAFRDLTLAADASIVIQGSATTVRTGSFTAMTPFVHATNTPLAGTDAAMPGTWTTDLGRRVRITAGPNAGQKAWVTRDLGAKQARFSRPHLIPASVAPFLGVPLTTMGTFSNGNAYVVETLPTIYLDELSSRSAGLVSGGGVWAQIAFVDLDIQSAQGAVFSADYVCNFYGCSFTGASLTVIGGPLSGTPIFNNCGFSASALQQSSGFCLFWGGCIIGGGVTAQGGGSTSFDGDLLIEGATLFDAYLATFVFSLCGVMNTPGNACITIYPGSISVFAAGAFPEQALWGTDNPGAVGVDVLGDGVFSWDGVTLPTITGSAADFRLAGAFTGRAWNEGGGVYSAALATSWANLGAAQPGGFGGNAHNVQRRASIVTQ